jgi:hypothetical protein
MIRRVTRIEFAVPPAQVSVGDGLTMAARYWAASVERWILPVIAIALASGLTTWLFRESLSDRETLQRLVSMSASNTPLDPGEVPQLVAGPLAVAIVSLVAGWFLTANAIAGLRNREVTLRRTVAGGLRSFVANLLIGLVVVAALIPLLGLGAVGLLVALAAFPVAIYLLLRVSFWSLAVFDGEGIGPGFGTSWTITRGAVLRVIGWSLVTFPLAIGLTVLELVVDAGLGPVSQPLADAIGAGADATLTSFTIIVLAVLYESQRARRLGPAVVATAPHSPLDPPAPPWG